MASKLYVLPDVLLFTALPAACTKIGKRPGKATIHVKTASYFPPPPRHTHCLHIQSRTPSVSLNQAFQQSLQGCLLLRHPDLSGRIWNFFRTAKWCTPEISTWTQKGNTRTPCCPVEKDPDLAELQDIAGPSNWKVICTPESQASCLPSLLPKKCPGLPTKMISEWLQHLLAPISSCISCYSSWVLHSDRGCQ